jgi:dTDP-4-dehydrorhamnose reductase
MKILGTGLSGLVGSYVVKRLSPEFEFENLSLETGIDITNPDTIDYFVSKSKASWVFHFAAKTDVDQAEKEKQLGEKSQTWIVNVGATRNLVNACKRYQKKLLYVSTDFVFPGGDKIFTEEDAPEPIGWYATTKYLGEQETEVLGSNRLIVRLSFPYGAVDSLRPDFVGRILGALKEGKHVMSPVDQVFVPTHLQTIADGIRALILHEAFGIYHLVGPEAMSSYDSAVLIAETFGYDTAKIKKTTALEFYKGRAPRAFHLVISNGKISELGVKAINFREGLSLLKEQL